MDASVSSLSKKRHENQVRDIRVAIAYYGSALALGASIVALIKVRNLEIATQKGN